MEYIDKNYQLHTQEMVGFKVIWIPFFLIKFICKCASEHNAEPVPDEHNNWNNQDK